MWSWSTRSAPTADGWCSQRSSCSSGAGSCGSTARRSGSGSVPCSDRNDVHRRGHEADPPDGRRLPMASASAVPETYELQGEDAKQTLKPVGWGRLLKDSFTRFRAGDGSTNSRSIAHGAVLTVIPGIIALVGVAS